MSFAYRSAAWRERRLAHGTVRVLACGAGLSMVGIIYLAYRSTSWWSHQGAYWYTSVSRLGFGASVAVLLWLCITGQCPMLNALLSQPVFNMPAKLTYSAYLVHPIIIRIVLFQRTTLIHYTALEHVTLAISMIVYAYFTSFVLNLLVELPTGNLIKLLLLGSKR
jgi:peptidoglycan/LPS O-acetylase OafA/YrhL